MSTVFRVQKSANYTTMSNYHLKDRRLSYKAKGLLSVILSLPEEWDYSLKGLACISDDGVDGVRGGIRELENLGYISRGVQTRDSRGRMAANEYYVFENPEQNPFFKENEGEAPNEALTVTENPYTAEQGHTRRTRTVELNSTALENPTRSKSTDLPLSEKPLSEKPLSEKPLTVNPTTDTLLNNKILTNQLLNNQSYPSGDGENFEKNDVIDRTEAKEAKSDFSFSELKEKILENIEYDSFAENEQTRVLELVDLMVDVIQTCSPTVRVNGGEVPKDAVIKRFMSLKGENIEYVLFALKQACPNIRNIRSYLITALYNSTVTQDNYYTAMVNHDMYHNRR